MWVKKWDIERNLFCGMHNEVYYNFSKCSEFWIAGMEDGHKVTFAGEGDQEPGLEAGDIVIVLDEKEHPVFKRSGNDLILRMELTLTEALCGFQKAIKTLDNRQLVISCIPGK